MLATRLMHVVDKIVVHPVSEFPKLGYRSFC